MKPFWRFYSWMMEMKFTASIYILSLMAMEAVYRLWRGEGSLPILHLLWIGILGFAAGVIQQLVFPWREDLPAAVLARRTIWWAVLLNGVLAGGSWAFGLFEGAGAAWGLGLVALLELGLFLFWIGLHVALRQDSRQLNQGLRRFQEEGPHPE